MKLKNYLLIIIGFIFSTNLFAQTKIIEPSKLLKILEKNKKTDVVFVSKINLNGIRINSNNSIIIPSLQSEKINFVADLETDSLLERIKYLNKSTFEVEFILKDKETRTYSFWSSRWTWKWRS